MWYIVKVADRTCQIVTQAERDALGSEIIEQWGGFADRSEAIAKRIGLIRAGKCQPL
jgi:hypothetical protein